MKRNIIIVSFTVFKYNNCKLNNYDNLYNQYPIVEKWKIVILSSIPLCSPKNTSLNFLSGLENSALVDISNDK